MKYLILGGGITGWTAAKNILVSDPAALVTMITTDSGLLEPFGNGYEQGGHVYSPGSQMMMSKLGVTFDGPMLQRRAFYHDGQKRWDYPVQYSMLDRPVAPVTYTGQSLEVYGIEAFGEDFYSSWFRPFNERVWGIDPSLMDSDWLLNRAPTATAGNASWGPNSTFRWALGSSIMKQMYIQSSRLSVITQTVSGLWRAHKGLTVKCLQGFQQSGFEAVISTIPINTLLGVMDFDGFPSLPYNQVTTYGVTTNVPYDQQWTWCYGPIGQSVHRVTNLALYEGKEQEYGKFLFEVPTPSHRFDTTPYPSQGGSRLSPDVYRMLERLGVSAADIVHSTSLTHLGYPAPVRGLAEMRKEIKLRMLPLNLFIAGRWGSHAYLNVDGAMMDGFRASQAAIHKGKDAAANSNYFATEITPL